MPDPTFEVYDLKKLFVQAAQAVIGAQEGLDGRINPAYLSRCQVEGHRLFWSIPHVAIELEFGLQIDQHKKLLFISLGKKRGERHTHHLRFSITATPEPPPAPGNGADLRNGRSISLLEPDFLLPQTEEEALCGRLLAVLKETEDWAMVLPDGTNRKPDAELRKKIQGQDGEARAIADELKKDLSERNLAVFQLDDLRATGLIVRLTDKSRNDGLFLFRPGARPTVLIYSFEKDDEKAINYQPLHALALAVREWLRGAQPLRRDYHGALPLGIINLDELTGALAEGYVSALALLAAREAKPPLTIYYDLGEVTMEMSYSVRYDSSGQAHLNFIDRASPDGSQQLAMIESRVVLRALRDGARPRVEVELEAPEFALSGAARQLFLEHAVRSIEQIAETFQLTDPASSYREFLGNEAYQRDVVVLLSYKDDKPREEFLVVWPGRFEGQPRDFVFTCKRDGDRLGSIKPVMDLSQSVFKIQLDIIADADASLEDEQYQAFHNFFHAVAIWRSRLMVAQKGES